MTIGFPCENCGHRFEVDASLAGKKCKCKRCGHVFSIPVPRASTIPAPDRASPSPPKTRASSRPSRAPRLAPEPDPYHDADDPYAADDPLPPPRKLPPRGDLYGLDDGDEVLPSRPKPRASEPAYGPKPAKSGRSRSRAGGEPWAPGLRKAAVYFMVAGAIGWVVTFLVGFFAAYGTNPQELQANVQAGRLPFSAGTLVFLGILGLFIGISFLIGMILTIVSFVGSFLSAVFGNNRAFGGDDVLLQVGWYASGLATLAIAGLFAQGVSNAINGLQPGMRRPRPPVVFPNHDQKAPTAAPDNWAGPNDVRREPVAVERPDENEPPPRRIAPPVRPRMGRKAAGVPGGPPDQGVALRNPRANAPPASDFVDQALSDLNSPGLQQRRRALGRLKDAPPVEGRRAEVAEAVEPLLLEPEGSVRVDAAKTLALWGSKENTPALIKAVNDPVIWVRWAALDALAEIKDPAAAEAVAARLTDTRDKAGVALRAMGPGAEPAVIKYLTHNDLWVRTEACKVLEEIGGSEECKVALVNVVRRANNFGFDADAARSALNKMGMPSPASRKKSIVPGVKRR